MSWRHWTSMEQPVEFDQALTALERIARQTMFAPESREAPVQVMGPLEAAGGLRRNVVSARGRAELADADGEQFPAAVGAAA